MEEGVAHRAADDVERRADGARDRLDEGGLAAARLAGQAVDLVAVDVQADVVDGADLAVDAEILHLVIGLEMRRLHHRPGRLPGVFPPRPAVRFGRRGHQLAPPIRLSRLRGSMYSFIEIASRNSPMKVIVTKTVGKTNHHQTPETMALCWLAQ